MIQGIEYVVAVQAENTFHQLVRFVGSVAVLCKVNLE